MPRSLIALAIGCSLALAGCESKDNRMAERLYEKAKGLEDRRQFSQAMEKYREIEQKYPATKAAKLVKETVDFKLIEDALAIDRLKNVNAVKEHLRQIAKAIENYHFQQDVYPQNLDVLVPSFLPALPRDPWGARYTYGLIDAQSNILEPGASNASAVDGYMLAWFGKDRIPGGEGDDKDVFVRKGQFIEF